MSMDDFIKLQDATLSARRRTGDATIGTRAKSGRVQVIRVTYPGDLATAVVQPLSKWLTPADAVAHIELMK